MFIREIIFSFVRNYSFPAMSSSGFGIRAMLASQKEAGGVPSSFFPRNLRMTGDLVVF